MASTQPFYRMNQLSFTTKKNFFFVKRTYISNNKIYLYELLQNTLKVKFKYN